MLPAPWSYATVPTVPAAEGEKAVQFANFSMPPSYHTASSAPSVLDANHYVSLVGCIMVRAFLDTHDSTVYSFIDHRKRTPAHLGDENGHLCAARQRVPRGRQHEHNVSDFGKKNEQAGKGGALAHSRISTRALFPRLGKQPPPQDDSGFDLQSVVSMEILEGDLDLVEARNEEVRKSLEHENTGYRNNVIWP